MIFYNNFDGFNNISTYAWTRAETIASLRWLKESLQLLSWQSYRKPVDGLVNILIR